MTFILSICAAAVWPISGTALLVKEVKSIIEEHHTNLSNALQESQKENERLKERLRIEAPTLTRQPPDPEITP